ncbi:hypothetical protein PAAG_11388 [Paracoccidioides lutzii Pb01]|uniref:Uncharacterized protein n=1 Tax=Paracoccidioides lutzii (strain ATCC MYA-826 / Pb01) TaxID=502779 RepID=A0A0A2V6S7_PARBA|nr:hypothetical protein PAAG_11388 [Paracoccidioides lutzii Pb01]KGQ01815.1 hypothetical protein PAAG_11388 [Paracoccidioides lutzii Pb01]
MCVDVERQRTSSDALSEAQDKIILSLERTGEGLSGRREKEEEEEEEQESVWAFPTIAKTRAEPPDETQKSWEDACFYTTGQFHDAVVLSPRTLPPYVDGHRHPLHDRPGLPGDWPLSHPGAAGTPTFPGGDALFDSGLSLVRLHVDLAN